MEGRGAVEGQEKCSIATPRGDLGFRNQKIHEAVVMNQLYCEKVKVAVTPIWQKLDVDLPSYSTMHPYISISFWRMNPEPPRKCSYCTVPHCKIDTHAGGRGERVLGGAGGGDQRRY